MQPNADAAPCINPLPEADVSLEFAGGAQTLLLGDSVDLDFSVVNNGTLDATNISASIDIPSNLTLNSITASAGSCSSGAGQASCTLGTIAGAGSATVSVAVTAAAVGSSTVSAAITADNDNEPANNVQSVSVSVDPAIDLRVQGGGNASVTVDDTVSIGPIAENLSTLEATNVVLSIAFSSGLRVESASWPNGSCTITGGTVECLRASFAAQSQAVVDIQLTAISTGSQTYTATISASETDTDQSNNTVTGTVTVSAASTNNPGTNENNASDSDSGGGAFGLLWLGLLAVIRQLGWSLSCGRRRANRVTSAVLFARKSA
jgi:uncharacterized repeat protein (TIGR01451 family)